MKKLMLLAAMLALATVVAVVPALAQQNDLFDDRFRDRFGEDFLNDPFFDRFFADDAADSGAGVNLSTEQEAESGDVQLGFSVENTGDYANQCTPAVQFGNTGNFNNAPVFQQYASEADEFEPGGIVFSVAPEMAVDCSSTIQQSSAASSYSDYWYGSDYGYGSGW
jgi:hypothetical protein